MLLANVTLPSGLVTIGKSAFESNQALGQLIIPETLESVEDSAFHGCINLRNVYFMGTSAQWRVLDIAQNNQYLHSATTYAYSEKEPPLNAYGDKYDGNYWHYQNNVITVWVYTPKQEEPKPEE